MTGKELTPFILSQVVEQTHGKSLEANMALVQANARLAGRLARLAGPLVRREEP